MKTLTITPLVITRENNEEQDGTTVAVKDLDRTEFNWKNYLKQERNHNLALAMFTK